MDDFCYIRCFVRLTQSIHVENKFIIKAFREGIRMKLPPSCQFSALRSNFLWMHNFIGKLFVLHTLSNRLQKAQITFEVLWRMQANIRNTFPLINSDLLGLFLFQFSAHTFKQTPKRTNMVGTISPFSQINLLNFILRWQWALLWTSQLVLLAFSLLFW